MKIMQFAVLILIISSLFLAGCATADKLNKAGDEPGSEQPEEDTGISDVFEDTDEATPPPIPG